MKSENPGKPNPKDKSLSAKKAQRASKAGQFVVPAPPTPTQRHPTTGRVHPNQSKPLVREEDTLSHYVPKTPLGKRLLEIRARSIASGMKLLTEEELDKEIAERKGGVNES